MSSFFLILIWVLYFHNPKSYLAEFLLVSLIKKDFITLQQRKKNLNSAVHWHKLTFGVEEAFPAFIQRKTRHTGSQEQEWSQEHSSYICHFWRKAWTDWNSRTKVHKRYKTSLNSYLFPIFLALTLKSFSFFCLSMAVIPFSPSLLPSPLLFYSPLLPFGSLFFLLTSTLKLSHSSSGLRYLYRMTDLSAPTHLLPSCTSARTAHTITEMLYYGNIRQCCCIAVPQSILSDTIYLNQCYFTLYHVRDTLYRTISWWPFVQPRKVRCPGIQTWNTFPKKNNKK